MPPSGRPSPFGAACAGKHNVMATPATVIVRIRFISSSLVDSDSCDSSCGFSKYLHVAGAALLPGVDALQPILPLAHRAKRLARLANTREPLGARRAPRA